ncbi:MAG: response regulator [Deltaproteobacteria bacterium]|jgi:CheY-like chemotaxis protein|nr:response regulator [Deltaproteobacteria bacterium]MBT4089367.1 response regulator [Deltaproteobacteria bacterium]MBT4269726.1 response regulator [Deltaproteobacteria bacterium]MBT4637471.1 response regulator [Deltaproteobacteria bacterium]MBT6502820.1 response regulator [Deltaproteobacteria bacterium]
MSITNKVLIVDDEEDVLIYLTALFREHGFETVTAEDGNSALLVAKVEKPDIITLDITMPEQSGIKTYRILKDDDELNAIPIIFVTAIGDSVGVIKKQLDGYPDPEGFIGKPIEHDKLIQMARRLVTGS